MKETKELLFAGVGSLIVILGLAYLNVFGLTMAYAPLLVVAALLGLYVVRESGASVWAVVLVSLAGVGVGIALQPNPQAGLLVSPAMGFGIALALPAVFLALRHALVNKK